jgi:hypothetical protein
LRCIAKKRTAAGKAIVAKLACQLKAMRKELAVDPACLQAADTKLASEFAKIGNVCSGEVAEVGPIVDGCYATFVGDVPSSGKCALLSTAATKLAAAGVARCVTKDATRAGTLAACRTKAVAKFSKALEKAGTCAQASLPVDLGDCFASIASALPRAPLP